MGRHGDPGGATDGALAGAGCVPDTRCCAGCCAAATAAAIASAPAGGVWMRTGGGEGDELCCASAATFVFELGAGGTAPVAVDALGFATGGFDGSFSFGASGRGAAGMAALLLFALLFTLGVLPAALGITLGCTAWRPRIGTPATFGREDCAAGGIDFALDGAGIGGARGGRGAG